MATKDRMLDRGWLETLSAVFMILTSAIGFFEIQIHSSFHGFDAKLNDLLTAGSYPERPDIALRTRYTGLTAVDYPLSLIITSFVPGLLAFNEKQQVQMAYFLFTVLSIIAIFSVEAFRGGSYRAWISYTSVYAALYQSTGGAVIFPIWFLLFLRHSARMNLYEPPSIRVPTSYAKALAPGHVLGYLLPCIGNFLPLDDPDGLMRQTLNAFWQPSPIYINIVIVILAQFYNVTNEQTTSTNSDVKHIKALHGCCFITSLVAHVGLLYLWTQSDWSMADIFVPRMSSLQGSVPEVIYYIFQVDFMICFAAALLVTYIVVMDLNLLKRCDLSPIVVGSSIVLGSILIGPGAAISAAWWWREGKLRVVTNEVRKGKRS